MNYIMEMDANDGLGMIVEAFRQKRREEAFTLYASVYPLMTEETFIPFERFFTLDNPFDTSFRGGQGRTGDVAVSREKMKEEAMSKVENIMNMIDGKG